MEEKRNSSLETPETLESTRNWTPDPEEDDGSPPTVNDPPPVGPPSPDGGIRPRQQI